MAKEIVKKTAKNILDVADASAYKPSQTNKRRSDLIGFGVSINTCGERNGEKIVFNKLNHAIKPPTNTNKIKFKHRIKPNKNMYNS